MEGVSIRISLNDLPALIGDLAETAQRAKDMTPLMLAVGRYGEKSTKLRFRGEVGPDGLPWKQSLRAKIEGGQTLSKSGQLRDSYVSQASSHSAEWGTNKIYARTHQDGGVIRAKDGGRLKFKLPGAGWVSPEQVVMPARPMLGINDDDRDKIEDLSVGYITGAWQ